MIRLRLTLAPLLFAVLYSTGHAQIFFQDDFDLPNGNPVTWDPGINGSGGGAREFRDGDYLVTHTVDETDLAGSFVDEVDDNANVSIRTQLRIEDCPDSCHAAVFARNRGLSLHWGAISADGTLRAGTSDETGANTNFFEQATTFRPLDNDVAFQFDIYGHDVVFRAWEVGREDEVQELRFTDQTLADGTVGVFTTTSDRTAVAYRWFEANPVVVHVGGDVSIGSELLFGVVKETQSVPSDGIQPGLLQRWFSIRNPGDYSSVLGQVFDPLFPEQGLRPDVPAFHGAHTWWTGHSTGPSGSMNKSVPGTTIYPVELVDRPRIQDQGTWNVTNNDDYTVFLAGEILIPESGVYRFLDGVDDLAVFGIDVNRDGVVDDELIINDNLFTDLTRDQNNGGLPEDIFPAVEFTDIAPGGEWFMVEAVVAEDGGGDAGIFYWDYDVSDHDGDGVKIGDAAGFPTSATGSGRIIEDGQLPHLLIPDEHLRSEGGMQLSGGTLEAELASVTYRFELGEDGLSDQLRLDRPASILRTSLDLNDANIEITSIGELIPGDYPLLVADDIRGEATLTIPNELQGLIDSSRLFSEGILMVLGDNPLDCSGDGSIDLSDANCATAQTINATLATAGLGPGDLNGDGRVQFEDFLILAHNFGSPGLYTQGDIDRNGFIQFGDFLLLAENFESSGVAAVPEPTTVTMLGLSVLLLLSIRRRHVKNTMAY